MDALDPANVEMGLAFAGVPRVMWPVGEVPADESLMGLVSRTAAENVHECTAPILEAAGLPNHVSFNLATRPDLDEARLARVIRLPEAEITKRRYHPVENAAGPPLVSFFGTTVALYDLHLRLRRVAPTRLVESPHHRAIWQHGLLPFDFVTGEWLVEACPRCEAKLAWYHSAGVPICDAAKCRFDLRSMCAPRVDPNRLEIASPICRLLDPDPTVHEPALAILPDPIRELGRGPAFELIWRLGRASVRGGASIRDVHKSLPADEIVDGICAGARLIAEWPKSLDLHFRRLVAEGRDADATGFARGLRDIGGHRQSWTAHRGILHAAVPQLVTTGRKAYMHATDDGVDGADARQILGVSTDRLVRARGCKLIRAAAASGDTNVHAVFSRTQLEHIRSALDDRTPAGRLAERLGISRHGVEQLVCLEEVDQADEIFVRELYAGLQLSTRSVDRLMNDLEDKSDLSIAADPESIPLRRALMLIGGREKPWGPILKALRDGSISFGLEKGLTLAARVRIRLADVDSIVAMRFDRAAHRFDFSTRVNRRDSQETLNLTPVLMMSALRGELKVPGSEERDLALNHVLRVARRRISGGEILARWGNGRRMPRQFKNTRCLFRLDATGWDRSEVEAAMLSVSLQKGKNSNA